MRGDRYSGRLLAALLCVGVLSIGYRATAAETPIGQVTQVKGTVTLSHGGTAAPCHILQKVFAGDKFDVARDARVTVMMFTDSHRELINGPEQFAMATTGAPVKGKVVSPMSNGLKAQAGALSSLNSDQYGIVANRGEPGVLLMQTGTRSLTDTPNLRWEAYGNATQYLLEVTRQPGEDPPYISEKVTGTSFQVKSPLERGHQYTVHVEAVNDTGQGTTVLTIVPQAEANTLKKQAAEFDALRSKAPDDASPYLALVAHYLAADLKWDAVTVFQQLAAQDPGSAYPHERLSKLYKSLGMDAESKQEAETAATLH